MLWKIQYRQQTKITQQQMKTDKKKVKPKKKTTGEKAAATNVIELPKKKKNKKDNISLDKDQNGKPITIIEHYKHKDLERWLTIDDCLLLAPQLLKKRTWESWRSNNRDNPELELGPQYKVFGLRVYKIKVIWLLNYIKGLGWEHTPQPTATNNISQHRSAANNI